MDCTAYLTAISRGPIMSCGRAASLGARPPDIPSGAHRDIGISIAPERSRGETETVVSGFMGGSAWSAARDIAGGFVTVTERTFRKMTGAQMGQLAHEVDRMLRELRGGATNQESSEDLQTRQRKIQRLNSAMMVLRSYRQKTRQ